MSNASQRNEILRAHGIHWVRDAGMTLLVNDQNNRTFILKGLEATIWDWLTSNFSYGKIAGLLAAILDSSISAAELRLNEILHQWAENGLLIIEENAAHD